jgi:hypothetical protein
MRLPVSIFVVTILLSAQTHGALIPQSERCVAPATTAKALERIQLHNWRDLSAERLTKLWPGALDEEKCKTDDALDCRMLETRDRSKDGAWGCGEAFVFRSEGRKDGLPADRLDNLFVHYSAADKKSVIAAARVLARGLGAPERQIATLEQNSYRRLEWQKSINGLRQSYLAEVRFTSTDKAWQLILSVSVD